MRWRLPRRKNEIESLHERIRELTQSNEHFANEVARLTSENETLTSDMQRIADENRRLHERINSALGILGR